MRVKDCLTPEAIATLRGYGPEIIAMEMPEFIAVYRNRAVYGPADSRLSAMVAACDMMGLPMAEDGMFTVPGEGWISRKDLEAQDAAQ